ncbi:hypothetical protein CY34DRAFT_526235 [Suillus luteus UH-Slu-Lm8-n1]|uniref:Uncharacterized protein n=1 Tax=Suillus luteus UH-Slu-Lm8-n1 TaxID=930992 RepID=A0A0C9ZFZ2_9AGAM|nr:hypothetical protein CY34DRAFT_526235 [Suillus luteus UH-Slu-Lm8-n1]
MLKLTIRSFGNGNAPATPCFGKCMHLTWTQFPRSQALERTWRQRASELPPNWHHWVSLLSPFLRQSVTTLLGNPAVAMNCITST